MHDCRRTKKILVDLVFGELDDRQQQQALAEVRGCPACSEQYQSMLASINAFDQSADVTMPDESYWTGYEARLRAKLAEPAPLNQPARLAGWFASLLAKPAIPLAALTGLILLIAAPALWFAQRQSGNKQPVVAVTTPSPKPSTAASAPIEIATPQKEIQPERQKTVADKPRQRRHNRPVLNPETAGLREDLMAANVTQVTYAPILSPNLPAIVAPAAHFEKAQMLLRTFRNSQFEGGSAAFDLPYEKQRANKLIYDNILLRREAEARGDLPVEEALISLEPLLLDIANLPDKPSQNEVSAIKERIQKQEIIATLNIVSYGGDRFSPPMQLKP